MKKPLWSYGERFKRRLYRSLRDGRRIRTVQIAHQLRKRNIHIGYWRSCGWHFYVLDHKDRCHLVSGMKRSTCVFYDVRAQHAWYIDPAQIAEIEDSRILREVVALHVTDKEDEGNVWSSLAKDQVGGPPGEFLAGIKAALNKERLK